MESYTFGSDEFMSAVALERMRTGENYPITLNDTDFRMLTAILRDIALYGEVGKSTRDKAREILGDSFTSEPLEDWAWQWLSGIGETLGIEGI